jgi:hypothetical protein
MKITYRILISYFLFTSAASLLNMTGFALAVGAESVPPDQPANQKAGAAGASTPANQAGSPAAATAAPAAQDGTSAAPAQSAAAAGSAQSAAAAGSAKQPAVPATTPAASAAITQTAPVADPQKAPVRPRKYQFGLAPGQKYKIAGFADGQSSTIVEDGPAGSSAAYHRVQMRLTGSMCYSCLLEIQEKLMQVFGVEKAKVTKTEQTALQVYAPAVADWADAVLFYDAHKLDLIDLRAYLRSNAYYPYKVVDREIQSLPSDDRKKI